MSAHEPDFDVTVRLRNNHLLAWRERKGLTQVQAAAFAGVPIMAWQGMELLRDSPVNRRWGGWNRNALRISDALGVVPERLWPEAVQAVRKAVVRRQLDGFEAMALAAVVGPRAALLPGPEEMAGASMSHRAILSAMSTNLRPRERLALSLIWGLDGQGERTLKEAGDEIGVSPERCRQIAAKAMRKLRHSSSHLRAHATEMGFGY
jgi:RNA polymerase sigma factor (sigma-70 family)